AVGDALEHGGGVPGRGGRQRAPRLAHPCAAPSRGAVSGSRQSISFAPRARRAALVDENGLLPKKSSAADSGEGWAALRTVWRRASMSFAFFCAWPPQSTNTTPSGRSLIFRITASVNVSQPWFRCEFGVCARTVSTVFRS